MAKGPRDRAGLFLLKIPRFVASLMQNVAVQTCAHAASVFSTSLIQYEVP